MKNFALQQPLEEWMILEFSQLGFIGEYRHHTTTSTSVKASASWLMGFSFTPNKTSVWFTIHTQSQEVTNADSDWLKGGWGRGLRPQR